MRSHWTTLMHAHHADEGLGLWAMPHVSVLSLSIFIVACVFFVLML